ncbi:hypothetical protein RZS08_18495, partial [Arthrospira platensis SPKY1]|nr:hypothetical protein [Arthrospira platensis SPKY1]
MQSALVNIQQWVHITTPSEEVGSNASATYVAKQGDYLYITYNTSGPDYGGGVDVFNLANLTLSSLTYTTDTGTGNIASSDFEWNSLRVVDTADPSAVRIAVVGDDKNGARLFDMSFNEGNPLPVTKRELSLPGISGNAVTSVG